MRRFQRSMSLTRQEWLRLLPNAMSGYDWRLEEDHAVVNASLGTVYIRFHAGEDRKLGVLQFSVMEISLEFPDCPEEEMQAFLRQFDRHFLRGGG